MDFDTPKVATCFWCGFDTPLDQMVNDICQDCHDNLIEQYGFDEDDILVPFHKKGKWDDEN